MGLDIRKSRLCREAALFYSGRLTIWLMMMVVRSVWMRQFEESSLIYFF